MPKLQPREIQKELTAGKIRPAYWLFGAENMKIRELTRRIQNALRSGKTSNWGDRTLDANEVSEEQILDSALSLSFGGGANLILVRNADALKELEKLLPLFTPADGGDAWVCIFISSKDLDQRRKSTKLLLEHLAVVPCEEVPESERHAWVKYLAERRKISLPDELIAQLLTLEPWSLDLVEQELEKYQLALSEDAATASAVLQGQLADANRGSEDFIQAFFLRKKKQALECTTRFASEPAIAIPLLGLLAWNTRHLALILNSTQKKTTLRLNPYMAERFYKWSSQWSLEEIQALQTGLKNLDFDYKQAPKLPLGIWTDLVVRFCK